MNWIAFFQNTDWNFWDVIVGISGIIIGVLVAYHIFLRERKKKSLSYEIITETQLISVHEEAKDRLEILFDGKPVKDVSLLIIKIVNDGDISIKSDDFEVPLTLVFDKKVEILSSEIIRTSEESLKPIVSHSKNNISFQPTLLNGKDEFNIKSLIVNYENRFIVEARIVGVKNVGKVKHKIPILKTLVIQLVFMSLFVILVVNIPLWLKPFFSEIVVLILTGLAFFLGIIVMFLSFVYFVERKK